MNCAEYSRLHKQSRPLAYAAMKAVRQAIALGTLPSTTGPCVDCGEPARCYDHRDYTKPLDVEAVCRSCNRLRGPAYPYLDMPSLTSNRTKAVRRHHEMRAFLTRTD